MFTWELIELPSGWDEEFPIFSTSPVSDKRTRASITFCFGWLLRWVFRVMPGLRYNVQTGQDMLFESILCEFVIVDSVAQLYTPLTRLLICYNKINDECSRTVKTEEATELGCFRANCAFKATISRTGINLIIFVPNKQKIQSTQ